MSLSGVATHFGRVFVGREWRIGQFRTIASAEIGLYLAFAAVFVILIGLWFHRAAYKPVLDAKKTAVSRSDS